jgi:hypothetical protein
MRVGIMQPYFFPYIGYFQLIHAVDTYVNLDHVSFMKRSYMTRNTLKNNTSINVNVYNGSQNKSCNEILVNFENKYVDKFTRTLQMLYVKSPYYSEIIDNIITPNFINREVSISQFNIETIKRICLYLDIQTQIINTSEGMTELKKGDGLKEITNKLGGGEYVNAIGGQALYTKENFKQNNIDLYFIKMGDVEFDNKYASILDLLFTYPKEHIQQQLLKYTLI